MPTQSTLPFATDRRALAAQMCHILAHGAEDPDMPLDRLGLAAREIAAFLLEPEGTDEAGDGRARLRVVDGGKAS